MTRGFIDEDRETSVNEKFTDVKATRATEKALLCTIGGEELWVPQSVIHDDSEVYQDGDEGTLVVAYWWAKSKGLV